jgi:Domain of unknown function (DUF1995)
MDQRSPPTSKRRAPLTSSREHRLGTAGGESVSAMKLSATSPAAGIGVSVLLSLLLGLSSAFSPPSKPTFATRCPSAVSRTRLNNVPPPSEEDAVAFREYASKQPPPASFFELQQDCVRATRMAIKDGHRLLEIEFPPLPAQVLEMDDVSAYNVVQANLNLALDFSKGLLAAMEGSVKKVVLMLPDEAEVGIAIEKVVGSRDPYPGITVSSLRCPDPGDDRIVRPEQFLLNLFGKSSGVVRPVPDADAYVCLTVSAQELPDIEALSEADPGKPIICYNLKLDVLRGDLGAPAFPPKEFQDRFLSKVKPVYYLRTRQYSRTTATPPFMVNFQGCLFRSYPGDYQTLLDTGTGRYRRLLGSPVRPALGEFKEQLTEELRKQGVIQEEGSTLNFLRTGYKTTTWWEEERPAADTAWKT